MTLVAGESVFFHGYETSEYIQYDALIRAAEEGVAPEVNLSWFDEGVESQANNVKNIEDPTLGATEDYWRWRYGDIIKQWLLNIGNSYLDTVRIEKGDIVLYRPWMGATFWETAYIAVVVSTLGAPVDPHPVINLRYINSSGTSILESNTGCLESHGSENDAQGNDIWSNVPDFFEFMEM